jgi:hypothetical protein
MDAGSRFAHHVNVGAVPVLAYPELMVPEIPVIQNLSAVDAIEIVFSPVAAFGDGIRIPPLFQWTIPALSPMAIGGGGGAVDVSDRAGRLLGIVASITAPVDVSDRAGRLLGIVASIAAAVDVSDRAARALGVVASITAPVDMSDRVGRLLGIVASITAPVDVSDRAGRLLGKAREDLVAMTWVSVRSAAPGIGAVQADTGALAAGDYDFDVHLGVSDTVAVGKGLVLEHRNAANGATLQSLAVCAAGAVEDFQIRRYTLALNERLRVIAGSAAGAAASLYVSAIGRRIS